MSDEPRTLEGKWLRGFSGNPGGYSTEKRAAVARVAVLAREHTEEAIKTLSSIMMDEKANRATRIAAANALLDRAWGRPPQSVGISLDDSLSDEPALSDLETARLLAFVLARGTHVLEQKEQERATAADAEIVNGDG